MGWGGQGGGSLLNGTAARSQGSATAASAEDVADVGSVVLDSYAACKEEEKEKGTLY